MISEVPVETYGANKLLTGLPEATIARLARLWKPVPLAHKMVVHEPYAKVADIYFPLSGVISWIVTMQDGNMAEAITIGREGVAGVAVVLGGRRGSTAAIVQSPGEALAVPADAFLELLEEDRGLLRMMHLYANVLINVMAQCAACNRLHEITERCARWLLMMHDRADGDEFMLVQEFLADMLGVRRPSVSVCASILQRAGYIAYKRGKVRIADRLGLESASCECYGVIRKEYDQMFAEIAERRS
ncbi:MAG: Crp/Fnr family transcriptional regulator [Vulcanimicrobiaceae bacterium]